MKILVVDDHPLIRAALQYALAELEQDVHLMEAASCGQAMQLADEHGDLDLILLDLELPDTRGFDALRLIRDRHPATPVVVLSGNESQERVVGSLDAGAMGFIPKSSSNSVLLGALRLVLSGGVYVPRQAIQHNGMEHRLRPALLEGETGPARLGLTERQVQVLGLMVEGKSNKLICRELNLAEGTVKIHVTAILKALNVSNRTQAVIEVGRLGIRLPKSVRP